MRILIFAVFLSLGLVSALMAQTNDESIIDAFSAEELRYIQTTPKVSVVIDSDYPPFSKKENGKVIGFAPDVLTILTQRTGLKFELEPDTWSNSLAKFKAKEVDVIAHISYKIDRTSFTLFTDPYYEVPTAVFVRDDFKGYTGIESLKNKRIGIVKNIWYEKELIDSGYTIITYDSTSDILKDLAFGKIDASIRNLPESSLLIKEMGYSNIKVAGEFTIKGFTREDLRFGVSPDQPILYSIMQKGMKSLSQKDKNMLIDKWIGFKTSNKDQVDLNLNSEEKQWLKNYQNISLLNDKKHIKDKTITIGVGSNRQPFEQLSSDGQYTGIIADYLQIIFNH